MSITKIAIVISAGLFVALSLGGILAKVALDAQRSATEFIAGPGLQTLTGAATAQVAIQAQMLAARKIQLGIDPNTAQATLLAARTRGDQAMEAIASAGLVSEEAQWSLRDAKTHYAESLEKLLSAEDARRVEQKRLDEINGELIDLGEAMEALGDSQVEALMAEPERPITWKDDVAMRWEAADGGMESSIGYLQQIEVLARLRSGYDVEGLLLDLANARNFHMEAMNSMLGTGVFDRPGEGGGGKLSERYRELIQSFTKSTDELFKVETALRASIKTYELTATRLLDELERLGELATRTVTSETRTRQESADLANRAATAGGILGLLCLVAMVLVMRRAVLKPMNALVLRLKELSSGQADLTQRLLVHSNNEMGQIALYFNTFVQRIQELVQRVRRILETLSIEAQGLGEAANAAGERARAASQESQVVEKSMQSIESEIAQVDGGVQDLRESIDRLARSAGHARSEVQRARDTVEASEEVIGQLGESAAEIDRVIALITSIAEQTNLLALNATIEAARAGEAGRGFAIVAGEVKELAKQTADATQQIGTQLQAIQSGTSEVTESVRAVGSSMEALGGVSSSLGEEVQAQTLLAHSLAGRTVAAREVGTAVLTKARTASQRAAKGREDSEHSAQAIERVGQLTSELSAAVASMRC